jgi:hypothetical protein
MRKLLLGAALIAATAAVPFSALAQAKGDPQRSDEVPPGLAKKLLDLNSGLLRAIEATEGSNSRLQDLPVSP